MKNRFIGITIIAIILIMNIFVISGCNHKDTIPSGNDNLSISGYKLNAKQKMADYVEVKKNNGCYTNTALYAINSIAEYIPQRIDIAEQIDEIDYIVLKYKSYLDDILPKNENSIEYKENNNNLFLVDPQQNTTAFIQDKTQLVDFLEDYKTNLREYVPLWEIYDEEYFRTNNLILCFFYTSSISTTEVLFDISKKKNTLNLHYISYLLGDVELAAIGCVTSVIEVEKSKTQDITNVQVLVS